MGKQIKWSIDHAHSEISFKVRHLMISRVKGEFKVFDASIYSSTKSLNTATFDLWIDAASITTGNAQRDEHLKSLDFLDVLKHKQISFVAERVGKVDVNGNAELWGELTIKGISKNIKLNMQLGGMVIDPWGNEKAGFTVYGKINRSDFGLVWNTNLEGGGLLVADEVSISCEMEVLCDPQDESIMELTPDEALKGA